MSFTPLPPPAPAPRSGPGWLLTAALAVIALVVGAGATFGGLLLTGWRHQPTRHYSVLVFFKTDVTEPQKDAARAVLEKIPSTGGVRQETSRQAYDKAKQEFKDEPEILDHLSPDTMPQSLRVDTVSRDEFDCSLVKGLLNLPGVDQYGVTQAPQDGHPGAKIAC